MSLALRRDMFTQLGGARARGLVAVAIFGIAFVFSFGAEQSGMTLLGNTVLAGVAAFTAWLSYRRQRVALVVASVLCFGAPALSTSFSALELIVVFVLVQVVWRSDLDPLIVGVIGFVSLTVNDLWLRRATNASAMSPTVLYPLILTGLAVGIGYQGRIVRKQNLELVALQDSDRQRAVLGERQRIARDLHDVAAHHLSALIVQNKLARRVATPAALDEAAEFSARTAHEALDALRQVVGVLSDAAGSPREPQPTLSDLGSICDRLGSAGLRVHTSIDPSLTAPDSVNHRRVRRDVELAAVRIAQEALTNVLRHRGPGEAWLSLATGADTLLLSIDDNGPDGDSSAPTVNAGVRGYGLLNMTERARSAGGALAIEQSPLGGWRITAQLPLLGAQELP
jgi:signal transduction histidine kinase